MRFKLNHAKRQSVTFEVQNGLVLVFNIPLIGSAQLISINERSCQEYLESVAIPTSQSLTTAFRADLNDVVIRCDIHIPPRGPGAVCLDLDPNAGYTLEVFKAIMMNRLYYFFVRDTPFTNDQFKRDCDQFKVDCDFAVLQAYAITVDICAALYKDMPSLMPLREGHELEAKTRQAPRTLYPGPVEAELCCRITHFLADVFERFRMQLAKDPTQAVLGTMIETEICTWPEPYRGVTRSNCHHPSFKSYFEKQRKPG